MPAISRIDHQHEPSKNSLPQKKLLQKKSLISQCFKNSESNAGSSNKTAKTPNLTQNPENSSLLAYQIMAKLGDTGTPTHARFRHPGM